MINRYLTIFSTSALGLWLIFAHATAHAMPAASSSAGGKYINLIQVLPCPADKAKYGEFNDYGYWQGGPWCGQLGKSGYWVWVKPKWYVWEKKTRK